MERSGADLLNDSPQRNLRPGGGQAAAGPTRLLGIAGAAFALASIGTNASHVLFHLVAGSFLGPAGYGALGALVALLAVLGVPVAALEAIVTAQVARRMSDNTAFDPSRATRRCLILGAAAGLVVLAASPILRAFVHLTSWWPVVFVAASCLPLAGGVIAYGVLCGQRRFATVGGITFTGALLRIGFAVVFLRAGLGVAGAVAASLCADCVRTSLLVWQSQRGKPIRRGAAELRIDLRQVAAGAGALGALQLVLGIDALLARHYLPPYQAGLYVAATTAARAVFFAAQILCTLGLPSFAVGDDHSSRRALRSTMAATAALGLAATAALAAIGPIVLPLAFGASFRFSPALLGLRGLAGVMLSLLCVLVQYRISRTHPPGARWAWLSVLIVVTAAVAYHRDAVGLAIATSVGIGLTLLPMARPSRRPRLSPAPSPAGSVR